MNTVEVKRDDVIKQMYFVLAIAQKCNNPMHSRTSNKDDYMGGIIDRFINTFPEQVVFSKILFPKLNINKKVEMIRDFYSYSPSEAKIAPDLLGIKVDGEIVPFAIYDDGWKPVENCPQVEIKTLKKRQYMVSLVDQGYEKSYLIFMESNFKVDYLMPFINTSLFNEDVYNGIVDELKSYDNKLIIKDSNEYVKPIEKLDFSSNDLGTIRVLLITKSSEFMKKARLIPKGVSPQVIRNIEKKNEPKGIDPVKLKTVCDEIGDKYYRFNDKWYSYKDKSGKYIRSTNSVITLDFYCSNIDAVELAKVNKGNFQIRVNKNIFFNKVELTPGYYCLELFAPIDRSGSSVDEYFIDKNLLERVDSFEDSLIKDLETIVNNN